MFLVFLYQLVQSNIFPTYYKIISCNCKVHNTSTKVILPCFYEHFMLIIPNAKTFIRSHELQLIITIPSHLYSSFH